LEAVLMNNIDFVVAIGTIYYVQHSAKKITGSRPGKY